MLKRGAYLIALSLLVPAGAAFAADRQDCPKQKRLLQLSELQQLQDEVAEAANERRAPKTRKCNKAKPIILM
ncbi:hypothetical protein [Sphingorhabdus sp. Alg239-R122]|uniref:hypothetical protein n=1 Tax=Sphingorhabdus sp. Alg239-R122 TaxID=2305989 RepID=UPI0019672C9A|nr:hypothetical protein [Sphingorhabdus sp. Alg239-R122]